ncbi:uncharacterized protein K452DRAFT_217023, partial [Aplosporella prunicola CBS 121167]
FTTAQGFMGIGPAAMAVEDRVVILYGSIVPLILRRCESSGNFKLVGECYVHGIMEGEA